MLSSLPNGLELHPPFPKDIGTMCGRGKGAARRLGLATIPSLARRQANPLAFFAHPPGQHQRVVGRRQGLIMPTGGGWLSVPSR